MQKWEYLFVVAEFEGNHWHPAFANGHEVEPHDAALLLHEYVNGLGEQGWELVAIPEKENAAGWGRAFVRDHRAINLVFKRPRP
jgi:hypothetical protein